MITILILFVINCENNGIIINKFPTNKELPICILKGDHKIYNSLRWKPYDSKIAFIYNWFFGNWYDAICEIDPDGNNFSMIPVDYSNFISLGSFSFSPDGDYIVFSAVENNTCYPWLYIVPSDGGEYRKIFDNMEYVGSYRPIYSPDGEWIYFLLYNNYHRGNEIFRVRPDGTDLGKVEIDIPGFEIISSIRFSSDGKYLLINCYDKDINGVSHIIIVSIDNSKRWILFKNRGEFDFAEAMPCFSPDNKYICFTDGIDLWIVSSKGGNNLYKLDDYCYFDGDIYPDWSYDGKWIIFTRDGRDSHYYLFKIKVPDEFLPG